MIQIEETVISNLILHRVNNGEDNSILSESEFDYADDEEEKVLKKIFLKPFMAVTVTCEFKHAVNIDYNVLFNLSRKIYEGENFIENSQKMAQHLSASSTHPNIKEGDLFIVKFEDVLFESRHFQGLGIYKFEDKESFMDASVINKKAEFKLRKGIGTKKPDKACMILFTDEPYTILVLDNNANDTDYWQNDFINHRFKNDHINNTNDFLNITKNFITKQIAEDFDISKADQIDLLNRSVDYFKTNESFNKQDFEAKVFVDEKVVKSFQDYDENFRNENHLSFADDFAISIQAVKKQARNFKSILKLDKNFHIYIHGDRELIEQGIDKDGRKFYKIYYEEEA
ncbi:MAG: nucleoid-associated protein [Ginsengibacter sp.]|jgi:hypothetical protein